MLIHPTLKVKSGKHSQMEWQYDITTSDLRTVFAAKPHIKRIAINDKFVDRDNSFKVSGKDVIYWTDNEYLSIPVTDCMACVEWKDYARQMQNIEYMVTDLSTHILKLLSGEGA